MLSDYRDVLEADLEQRGVKKKIPLSDRLLDRLLHEAFVRAGQADADGIARVRLMYEQMEAVSEQAALICYGDPKCDPVIARILSHQNPLEPNHTAEPASPSRGGSS